MRSYTSGSMAHLYIVKGSFRPFHRGWPAVHMKHAGDDSSMSIAICN